MDQHSTRPIGTAARIAGVSVKMARHYEAIGLLPRAARGIGGVRRFTAADIHTLRFMARARSLGFPLENVRRLLSLWQNPRRSNVQVLRLAEGHRHELLAKRAVLEAMSDTLQTLIDACAGDGRPECPIIENLAHSDRARAKPGPQRPVRP